ncbi:MAG TPA: hypothetical protein VE953_11440 [Terriglobales bacterium]|nr:hypothetical protein [Terriglobales bacterium]
MRLDPAEIASLPLPAALLDRGGAVVAATPEWQGAMPGSICYHAGEARLLVAPDGRAWPAQEAVMRRLLDEMHAAVAAMTGDQALCAAVLGSGLELVAGWPPDNVAYDSVGGVLGRALTVIRSRVPEAEVEVAGATAQPVPAPDQIALALLQFAANAFSHEGSTRLRLRVGVGPTFFVEWPAAGPAGTVAGGQSHPGLRRRWGLGYVRMVADYLGATALPPGPTAAGWTGPCLSLGSRRLTLPLAVYSRGQAVRATQTWEQSVRSLDPAVPGTILADLAQALEAAEREPGVSVRCGLLSARWTQAGTWVALPPETGPERTRDVLRGLDHERVLWSAPEPHATRVHGLISLLARSLGDRPTAYAPEAFMRELPRACAALGVATPDLGPLLACPDPRATAFLLAELGGELIAGPDGTYLAPSHGANGGPLLELLGVDAHGRARLTPGG